MDLIYTVEEITNKLKPIFDNCGVTKVILFGSYAKGIATAKSDIDLVVGVEDWVDIFDFSAISVDVTSTLGKEIDFLPMDDVILDSYVDKEIKNTGRLIYEKS